MRFVTHPTELAIVRTQPLVSDRCNVLLLPRSLPHSQEVIALYSLLQPRSPDRSPQKRAALQIPQGSPLSPRPTRCFADPARVAKRLQSRIAFSSHDPIDP